MSECTARRKRRQHPERGGNIGRTEARARGDDSWRIYDAYAYIVTIVDRSFPFPLHRGRRRRSRSRRIANQAEAGRSNDIVPYGLYARAPSPSLLIPVYRVSLVFVRGPRSPVPRRRAPAAPRRGEDPARHFACSRLVSRETMYLRNRARSCEELQRERGRERRASSRSGLYRSRTRLSPAPYTLSIVYTIVELVQKLSAECRLSSESNQERNPEYAQGREGEGESKVKRYEGEGETRNRVRYTFE